MFEFVAGPDATAITARQVVDDFSLVCSRCGSNRIIVGLGAPPRDSFGSLLQCRACAAPMNIWIDSN